MPPRSLGQARPPFGIGVFGASHGLSRRQPRPHQAVADHRHQRSLEEVEGRGARHHWPGRRRARFRHARQHQGGGDRRHPPRRDEIHRRRRHAGAEAGYRREVQARERPRLQAVADQCRHRRQAGAVQRAGLHHQSGRRGGDPGALLGELSGHRAVRRRQAGDRADAPRGRLQDEARGARARDHAQDQVADLQLAVEPDRRRLHARGAEGAHRRAGEASACLGADRRHVRAPGLRRIRLHHAGAGRAASSTSAR